MMAMTGPMVLGPVLGMPLEGGDTYSKKEKEKNSQWQVKQVIN